MLEKLTDQAKLIGCGTYKVCQGILEDERFSVWSGSSKPHQHHYGKGGLIKHTSEVIDTCFRVKSLYEHTYEFDSVEVFLAAFFHDVGKMYDYEPKQNYIIDGLPPIINYDKWYSAPHKRMIHHISRSAIMWSEHAKKSDTIYDKYYEKVLHAILSHHMCREAGSPVAPKSRAAWLLTLCDNLSARMYDADTFDVLDG